MHLNSLVRTRLSSDVSLETLLRAANRMQDSLSRVIAWAGSPRHCGRLLAILVLLSLPKLALIGQATYEISWRANWDESHIVASLDRAHDVRTVLGWFHGDWVELNGFYRPLTSVSIWLDYFVWGHHHRGYLVTSWILQCLTAWLLAMLVGRLMKDPVCGFLSGASVAVVVLDSSASILRGMAARTDGLCAVWILTSLLMAMKWIDEKRPGWLLAALGACLCALWSKEMAVSVPVWILVCGGIGAGREGWRRTAFLSCLSAVLVVLWVVCYHQFVPHGLEMRAMSLSHQVWRSLGVCVSHSVPSLHRFHWWWITGHDYSVLFFPFGQQMMGEFLLVLVGAVLIGARFPRALLLFVGWEISSWIPLLPVKLAYSHYDYIPDLGRHMIQGAFAASLLKMNWHRLTCRRGREERDSDASGPEFP